MENLMDTSKRHVMELFSLQEHQVSGSIINIASMYGVVASYPDAYDELPVNSPPDLLCFER